MQLFLPIKTRLHLLENLIKYDVIRFNANCKSSPYFRCTLRYLTLCMTHGLNINNALLSQLHITCCHLFIWKTCFDFFSIVTIVLIFPLIYVCQALVFFSCSDAAQRRPSFPFSSSSQIKQRCITVGKTTLVR